MLLATGVHWADAILQLPELCTKTTVVASREFSLADLVVRMPVSIAVSPNRRTDTSLNVHSVCGLSFGWLPALAVVFGHINPIGITSTRLSISIWSMAAPSPPSKALNHLACHRRVTKTRIAERI